MDTKLDNIDNQMFVIKEFIDEFYNKTVFSSENSSGSDLSPSLIKSLFAFADENVEYPIGELGENARVKRSTMTDMVDRMERDGIAERVRDPEDRRLVKVRLTGKGKQIRQEFYIKRRAEFENVFSQLQKDEVRDFIHHLAEASKILKKIH
ncbi:MarR family winged helix-turn-helix transcriptional regulator [Thermodesulfobacteriota bacterium]